MVNKMAKRYLIGMDNGEESMTAQELWKAFEAAKGRGDHLFAEWLALKAKKAEGEEALALLDVNKVDLKGEFAKAYICDRGLTLYNNATDLCIFFEEWLRREVEKHQKLSGSGAGHIYNVGISITWEPDKIRP